MLGRQRAAAQRTLGKRAESGTTGVELRRVEFLNGVGAGAVHRTILADAKTETWNFRRQVEPTGAPPTRR